MKLTPVVNFINILRTNFYTNVVSAAFSMYMQLEKYVPVTREKLPKQCLYEMFALKMLMKLTPGLKFINILRT